VQKTGLLTFWTNAGLTFNGGTQVSDPRIVYDPLAQRWFASAIDIAGVSVPRNNRFLLAVSAGPDPTGLWQAVAFTADPAQGNFADFPTLGMDASGVYLTGYMFSDGSSSGTELGANTLVSIPKADLLLATPTATNRTWLGLLAAGSYGYILQPAVCLDNSGSGNVLAAGSLGFDAQGFVTNTNIITFALQNTSQPGGATLTTPALLSVPPYRAPLNPTQPDLVAEEIDDGDGRFSAVVRQVGGLLYAVQGTQVSNRAALRWYKIDPANQRVMQSGTIADGALDLFYPSIAANSYGTVLIGFNGCSTNTFISAYAVVGTTSNGITSFGPRILLKGGVASYQDSRQRWGDYSTTCVDPSDPHRFWTLQMIAVSTSSWSTQITELLTAYPVLSIAATGTNVVVSWPGTTGVFNLETSPSLGPANWTPATQGLFLTNGQVSVVLPASSAAQFFRLHHQ
jgi:hypothetical protein